MFVRPLSSSGRRADLLDGSKEPITDSALAAREADPLPFIGGGGDELNASTH